MSFQPIMHFTISSLRTFSNNDLVSRASHLSW